MTPAEATLWKFIQNGKLDGYKFRRQHGIGDYIVDFYCPSAKLAIELDGEVHEYDKVNKKDVEKVRYIESIGIKVLRFENKYIFTNLDDVVDEISKHL